MASSRYRFEWPSRALINEVKDQVVAMSGCSKEDVMIVVSPYRVCPLGAHIDHQGGSVTAMVLDKGVLLGFVSSGGSEMHLKSRQFAGDVRFGLNKDLSRVCDGAPLPATSRNGHSEVCEEGGWGDYARGAVYALKKGGYKVNRGIVGLLDGLKGLHGAGISSSAAVGVAFLLALEHANGLSVSPEENIQLDKAIENEFLGLRNGILDQSAILLSQRGCLTVIHCKDQSHELISPPEQVMKSEKGYKLLLAFSGLQHALSSNSSYNSRVSECQEAARELLKVSGRELNQPLLCDVTSEEYQKFKTHLNDVLDKRARHFFTESDRVCKGCEPMIQLLDIMQSTRGVFGARFSGAGFRGCCVALVAAEVAEAAACHIEEGYRQAQPLLAKQLENGVSVLICGTSNRAYVC